MIGSRSYLHTTTGTRREDIDKYEQAKAAAQHLLAKSDGLQVYRVSQ